MNISPFVLATWVVLLASSGVWVSAKNDDLEATAVALSCTLLRFCFFSSEKSGNSQLIHSGEGDNETAAKEKDLILPEDNGEINLLDGSHSVDR